MLALSFRFQEKNSFRDPQLEEVLHSVREEEPDKIELVFSTESTVCAIVQALKEDGFTSIRQLGLIDCNISDQGFRQVIHSLDGTQLVKLNLSRNRITSLGLRELANCKLPELTTLLLDSNLIGDGFQVSLAGLDKLARVSLCDNAIMPSGMEDLAQFIAFHPSLRILSLRSSQIGNEGCICLARVLAQSRLQELRLGRNGISDQGASVLAQQVALSNTLRYLDLSDNSIGTLTARILACAFPASCLSRVTLTPCLELCFSLYHRLEWQSNLVPSFTFKISIYLFHARHTETCWVKVLPSELLRGILLCLYDAKANESAHRVQ